MCVRKAASRSLGGREEVREGGREGGRREEVKDLHA
jgi:hypothetical protein